MGDTKHRADTKKMLVNATKELLCDSENFTVKEISEKAFTNVAAINYHFGDKNSLVLIALNELLEDFKRAIIAKFDREFDDSEEALEDVLKFLLDVYSQYKGAIKYILLFENPALEARLVESFFFDKEFSGAFMKKISETVGEADEDMLFYRLTVMISAFLFPLLIEGKTSSTDDKLSLSALQREENKKAFIRTIMLLFK